MRYDDRHDAGRRLAARLEQYRDQQPIVVALPRGGVPVGYEVAQALGAPLDVLVARKIGAPGHAEYGIGAVAQGGGFYLDDDAIAALRVGRSYLEHAARDALAEIERRVRLYRGARAPLEVRGRVVILVDDGLATGVTTRAAVRSLRQQLPRQLVLAVPVCAPESIAAMRDEFDQIVCAMAPRELRAVGLWYRDFAQTEDDEVVALMDRAAREHGARVHAARPAVVAPQPQRGTP